MISSPLEERLAVLEERSGEHDRRLNGIEKTLGRLVERVAAMAGRLGAYALIGSLAGGGLVALLIRAVTGP